MIINSLLIGWFISHFEPVQSFLDKVYKLLPERLQFTRTYMGCFKCLTFWITLLMTFNIYTAILFSMIAYTYDRVMSSIKIKI